MSAREVLQAVRLPMEIVDGDDGRKIVLYGEIGPRGIDAILFALDAAGYAVVPKEPTANMLADGALMALTTERHAQRVWEVMIEAAKETT